MIDPLTLRSRIQQICTPCLGQYTFSVNGVVDSEPAIAILPDDEYGWHYPPSGTKTSGVEVVITLPYPKLKPMLNNAYLKEFRWGITLKQWNQNGNLLQATNRLVIGLRDYLVTPPQQLPPDDSLGILEQVRFEIVEYEYQN